MNETWDQGVSGSIVRLLTGEVRVQVPVVLLMKSTGRLAARYRRRNAVT